MKRKITIIVMFLLCQIGMIKATNTDVSSIENVLYVSSFTVNQGSLTTMSINMKNTAAIRGFQFNLVLPDGVSVVKSAKGKIQASFNDDRLPEEDEHTLAASVQEDGSILFLIGSQYDETFTGTDGVIINLQIEISNDMSLGDYPIQLKNVKLTETDISIFYTTELVESTITVVSASDVRTLLDETSTVAPTTAEGVNVKVKRTISAGNWNTICLPFAMSAEQVTAAFGSDVKLGDFNGIESTKQGTSCTNIKVNFVSVTAIEANHPYIIKVSSAITEFIVDGVNINPATTPSVNKDETALGFNRFIGTYVANTPIPNKTLFLSGNKFYYSSGSKTMKGYRGYFSFMDVLADVASASSSMMLFITDETTGITNIERQDSKKSDGYYDLQGRRIEKPAKGLYIHNGRKVVIK